MAKRRRRVGRSNLFKRKSYRRRNCRGKRRRRRRRRRRGQSVVGGSQLKYTSRRI